MKTKQEYRHEALSRLERNKVKKGKGKLSLFGKVKHLFFIRMVKQEPNGN